jgi:geranylgeranyl transferase type-1 subunit beta
MEKLAENNNNKTAAAHAAYFRALLHSLPDYYVSLETTRLTAIYFCVVGLDILGELDDDSNVDRQRVIDYILSLQVKDDQYGGFIGGTFQGQSYNERKGVTRDNNVGGYAKAHIAATYSALAALATLGYDLDLLDKDNIMRGTYALICVHG